MNEGFATLYEWYLVSLLYPEDRLMDSFVLDAVHVALAYDGNDVRAMTKNVETPSEIDDLFDDIAYEKCEMLLN
jgi:aminopeptidase N